MAVQLSEKQQAEGWRVVKFGDICQEVKATSKNPEADGLEHYIGLEHLDSGSLRIKRRGSIAEDNPSFTKKFSPGHLLFGKRRCYLKKAAVADFEGICSGDIIIMAPKGEIIMRELLPFIVQSDAFWNWAEQTSSGSLSPRTKFKNLAEWELPLPPVERQRELLKILTMAENSVVSADGARESGYFLKRKLLHETFSKHSPDWTKHRLGALFDVQLGKMLSPKAREGKNLKPYLRNVNIQWNRIDVDDMLTMNFNEKECVKFSLKQGDILVCEGGEIGRSAIWQNQLEECYYQKALHRLRPLEEGQILPDYMLLYMEYKFLITNDFLAERTATTIAHLPRVRLLKLPVLVPPLNQQKQIISLFFELQQQQDLITAQITNIRNLQNQLQHTWH